ncbi:hypothetical protein BSP109_02899 [Brevibacterium sp. Mu109]|uniref:DUF5819 family protein n=1 Tax=Brevibacterium sp. Mu109 TaxID=1255669 RepID=UPI000C595609|nr:DUF5819 family protein [Brevibacterium sp. Mu109]SMX95746.1 hypothetical protein BSP109_02899 [Brevibacterium sp. Mu109]
MVVALVMTAWHVAASFLWIAPAGPARDAVPGDALRSYMLPMYGQSWSVFAPAPINGDHRLDIRAVVVENGEERVTDWVRATDVEISLSRHNLFPPRAANLAINVSSAHKSAYDDLNDDHEAVVAVDYVQDEWQPRLEEDLESDDDGAVDPYLEAEEELTAYATQVAYAVWGENVARVQFQTTRQNVVPFAERNEPDAQKPPLQVVNTGWRGLIERDGQSREQFANYFCSAPEDVCS